MVNDDQEPGEKRKYVFFSDPDVIARRAEASASVPKRRILPAEEGKLFGKVQDYQTQPHPFTFITAVKRKLALAAEYETCKRIQILEKIPSLNTGNIPPYGGKMDFIKPLKVPDMKISPKNMDFSPRVPQKLEKSPKISLAHRKLDFSQSEETSFMTSDEVELLKVPDISFTSGINKKKDHARENSKEKENRSKRTKKDEMKGEESSDTSKRRSIKHTSRKEYDEIVQKSKNDKFLANLSKESDLSDFLGKKSKPKGFVTSTTRKDDDRKLRSSSSHSMKSRDRSLEPRSRTFSSESISDRNSKCREFRPPNNDPGVHKYSEDLQKLRTPSRDLHKKPFDQKNRQSSSSAPKTSKNLEGMDHILGSKTKEVEKSLKTVTSIALESKTESSEEIFLDPRRISFRDDSYSNQDEFCNLVTPDMNLLYRPKKRRESRIPPEPLLESVDTTNIQRTRQDTDENQENPQNVNLLHPTALHMQFQAELHLFDSYNESLRQVMDVENCLYNVQQEKARENLPISNFDGKTNEKCSKNEIQRIKDDSQEGRKNLGGQFLAQRLDIESRKVAKEVQTQTANDIATQTDITQNIATRSRHPSITYTRGDMNQLSLGSIDEFDDFEGLEKLQRLRTMSEISLHETTSSIKTETGTEISISTRDVTCSFNKYLDLEMAQLIKDEAQMYDKIEMLFKSREKTLNDRSRKLVKLEEQKRALRDAGQDSRISSVKKKQRALLLKLQQEKDEMNRLKELHKLASQERKVMLQKQRNMFNPTMSTKNILTKLKRSADCQSPRRLSGPMKGYDIRSNSSISSVIDSDKSQIDKSKQGLPIRTGEFARIPNSLPESTNSSQIDSPHKFDVKNRKFEEKMPKGDVLRLRAHQLELEEKLNQSRQGNISGNATAEGQEPKSESDTLVEDLTRKLVKEIDDNDDFPKLKGNEGEESGIESLRRSKITLPKFQNTLENKPTPKRKTSKSLKGKSNTNVLTENILWSRPNLPSSDEMSRSYKRSKADKEDDDAPKNLKNSILEELDMNDSQNSIQTLVKHSKALKEKNYRLLKDIADEEAAKENFSTNQRETDEKNDEDDAQNLGNISTRSQVSTLTISRHSSGDSEKSYSRSVVIRSQDHRFKVPKKLEQVLNAREAALATRRNCVEDWIAWHARLKAEESRVARMEEAAYKLVSATTTALCNDTTVSSEASDVEGRVELLAEKLAERRAEKAKLKREARKQNKQKLKALEANLLNQIKKYDTTIHEMRRKLDSKRGLSRDNGKLAIEAKAVAGVKVPEIPLKRIRDIYRNSDLLRSRSESDLLTSYTTPGSEATSVNSQKHEKPHKMSSRSIESILEDAKSISMKKSTSKSSETMSEVDQSTQDATRDSSKNQKSTRSIDSTKTTEKSSEILTHSHESSQQPFSSRIDFLQLNNQNLNEDISNLENDLKALSEMMSKFSKKSDEKLRSALISTSDKDGTPKSTSRDISEDLPKSQASSEDPESIQEILGSVNSSERIRSPIISIKSTEIEMISTKPSNEMKSSTSKDHSEDVISLNLSDENLQKTSKIIDVDVTEVMSGIIPSPETSKISEEIDFKARSKEILNEIEKSIILVKPLGNNSGNILEISASKLEENMEDLKEEKEALSSDFNFIEGNIKSISEIISELSENQRTLILEESEKDSYMNISREKSFQASISKEKSDLNKRQEDKEEEVSKNLENLNSTEEILEELTKQISDNNGDTPDQNEVTSSSQGDDNMTLNSDVVQIDEAGNESSLESLIVSNTRNTPENQEISFEQQGKSKNESDWTISDSFEVPNDTSHFKSHSESFVVEESPNCETTTDDFGKSNGKIEDLSMNFHDFENNIDVSYFVPNCESTNIDGVVLRFQDPELEINNKPEEPLTDELGDILDIIERDSKQSDHKKRANISQVIGRIPDGLPIETSEDRTPTDSPELNLTADVEPVLQKLTEILQSVERNIARRTQSKKLDKVNSLEFVESESIQQDLSKKLYSQKTESISDNVEFPKEINQEIDFKDENLLETDIDVKGEINEHLDEALDRLSIHEESGCHQNATNSYVIQENLEEIDKNDSNEVLFKKPVPIQEVLKDPEYEDISEESMEVSEILDKSESTRTNSHRLSEIPEKFEKISKTDDVLRILDEISQQGGSVLSRPPQELPTNPAIPSDFEKSEASESPIDNVERIVKDVVNDRSHPEDSSEESSEDAETPRKVSELDLESSREPNSSRLDIEALDDDLLTSTSPEKPQKLEFLPGGSLTTSEKDIEMMIDKLRASLDQPGLEVAELDARLLRIEQLQIELQIKKLEAEEVSYYVREIPNKPPPPYTPPGGPKTALCLQISKNFPPPVVPSNVEELTAFTEKATLLIYDAKQQGNDIMALSVPADIYESAKTDSDLEKPGKNSEESSKNDRKIYNSFLFDLCKETVAEIYQSEYEKPGPSWTKPNFKTKTVVKLPKNVEELNEYVCKEVATLFGFKTKLQRENMVMRWSRKRRDRVDELLAREAQAEEDEWTKFHHDELAVKNELTVAILDTLMRETTSVVKAAYAKKRKVVV